MDLNVWYQVIIPCLEVGKTAVIMISTPQGRWNFYSELTSAVDDRGMSIFNVVRCFAACSKCVADGKETDCHHICENRPHWKPESSQRKTKGLYGNNETMYQREILGKIQDDQSSVFAADRLEAFFAAAPQSFSSHGHVSTIYVAVDPNGGGSAEGAGGSGRSQTAIISLIFHGANVIIVGLDVHLCNDDRETCRLVLAHINGLRNVSCFREANIVVLPEANLGNEAQAISRHVIRLPNVHVATERNDNRYGIMTTGTNKPQYVFNAKLKMDEDAVRYHAELVVANPFRRQAGESADTIATSTRNEFERQLSGFRSIDVIPTTLRQTAQRVFTGQADQHGHRSSRMRDDMVMAFMIGIYWGIQHKAKLLTTRNDMQHLIVNPGMPY